MAIKVFEYYGHFCATYSLEVIVCFLTMVVGAITLNLSSPYELCNWATYCTSNTETEVSSDAVLLTVLRCGTIIYVYWQLKKMWKSGSLLVVGIVCAYAVFAVMTFTVTVVHFLKKELVNVSSALPVFLLLIDISRMVLFTQHCLGMTSIDKLQDRVAEGIGSVVPVLSLDTLVELLLLMNVGGYIQVRQLQQLCCFACLSVIINYMVFTTFMPACLSVYLSATDKNSTIDFGARKPSWHDKRFSEVLHKPEGSRKILTNRIKVLLCLMLLVLYGLRSIFIPIQLSQDEGKMQSSFDSIFTLRPEQLFTVALICILTGKYLFDDYEIFTNFRQKQNSTKSELLHNRQCHVSISSNDISTSVSNNNLEENALDRTPEEMLKSLKCGSDLLSDAEIISLVKGRKLLLYKLERDLNDANRGVMIRRQILSSNMESRDMKDAMHHIPHDYYDFTTATKACCENTVGYIPVPVGIVGPLLLNGKKFSVPMATTEGTLLASTNRGLKAIFQAGGVKAFVYKDGMTRAPVVRFPSVEMCCEMMEWLQDGYNFTLVKEKFDETSRYARLKEIKPVVSGRLLYLRFAAHTGDAMGMNMVSKGVENSLRWLKERFPQMDVVSLSGNFCSDKKPSAVNWIEGRGKSVVAEAVLPAEVVQSVLKTDVAALVDLNHCKNHIGSAMAGSIGGLNAHAANIVTALFIATGQDPAQNVVSSNCVTTLQVVPSDPQNPEHPPSLLATCTMPSLEVATVGGGCALDPQKACLKLLGVAGSSSSDRPGENAVQLAKIVCATVLAGELSLLSALRTGDLVQSHMNHNRLHRPVVQQEQDHNIL